MKDGKAARRYKQAKAIAHEALEQPADKRKAYVESACDGDPELESEVWWLVEAAEDESADQVPEQFHAAVQGALREVSLEVPLPRNYRLIRRLNEGGTGVVYLAERADGDISRQVALKLLQLTEAPDESLTRHFVTEHRALSRLNHPSIAHLIDGGLTAEGRPFLATEFVDGIPIDQWCEQENCSTTRLLDLFLKVCNAVDYAHRHMVIHRDLKPENILVTPEGEPKLLDFGIARLIDAKDRAERNTRAAGDEQAEPQAPGQALTLAYASPEQIQGDGLSAATDVYSLGVVLYQLLSGARPFDHVEPPSQLPAAIRNGEFMPLRKVSRDPDEKAIPRDLEAIVHKALDRSVEQRYESVRELADDLRRFRAHRPVVARNSNLAYRARLFTWRHRWSVAAGLGLTALVVTFMVDREAQLQRIAWERDRAEAVTEFINELFAGADSLPSRGNEVTVREILDLGTRQVSQEPETNPATTGSIHLALGRAYNALGLGEEALPLLHQAQQALSPSIPMSEQALIQAQVGAALDSGGRAVEAIAADQKALELFEAASGDHSDEILNLRIRKLRNHANLQDVPLDQTIEGLNEIIAELEARPEPADELLFEAKTALVGAYVFQDAADPALEAATGARELSEKLYDADDPRRLRGLYAHATAMMLHEPDTAVGMYQSLIEEHERLIGPSQRLANTIGNYGVALSRVGRDSESLMAFRQAADMIEEVAGRDHYLYRLSISNLAALHLRNDEPAQAEELIRDILADLERRAEEYGGVETAYRATALDILGSALTLQGRLEEAEASYTEALALLDSMEEREWPALESTIEGRLENVREEMDRAEGP